MQTALLTAAILILLTGLIHSVLGEILIFKHLRTGSLIPAQGAPPLRERNIRIIWATWHLATVLGWAFAGILLKLASSPSGDSPDAFILVSVVAAYAIGGLLVLVGTRGRHPGWVALLAVAGLAFSALSAA